MKLGHSHHHQFLRPPHFCKCFNFSVVAQDYITEAHNVHVIIGNVALVKCEIPSFVSDFVSVVSWTDGHGNQFFLNDQTTLGNKNHNFQLRVTQAFCRQTITNSEFWFCSGFSRLCYSRSWDWCHTRQRRSTQVWNSQFRDRFCLCY